MRGEYVIKAVFAHGNKWNTSDIIVLRSRPEDVYEEYRRFKSANSSDCPENDWVEDYILPDYSNSGKKAQLLNIELYYIDLVGEVCKCEVVE